MNTTKTLRLSLKGGLLMPMALTGLAVAPHAWADGVVPLLSQSTLVVGTESTTDTFTAPTAGTVTVNLTSFDWAAPLSALSFSASSATQLLASWYGTTGMKSDTMTFNVGPGNYFANIMATASGPMDMGLYSMRLTFTPNSTPTVPLPSSGWLLLTGMFVLAGLARAVRPLELMGTAEA
jgi:hypothetical protein